jgi:hypothetical protein
MGNSKDILDRLVDELGDALVLDRGSDNAFKAQVYQGLLRAQQAMGTCRTFSVGRQQPGSILTSQQAQNPLEDDALITAHSQLRQIFSDMGQWRQRWPKKVMA